MELDRFDVVDLMDLDFVADRLDRRALSKLRAVATESSPMLKQWETGFGWLFYPHTSRDNSVRPSLPGTERFDVSALFRDVDGVDGGMVLLAPEFGVGVLSVWRRRVADLATVSRAQDAKRELGAEEGLVEKCLERVGSLLAVKSCERDYPFLALRVRGAGQDLDRVCRENAATLGWLLTGNYEEESTARLEGYINGANGTNISTRGVERLFMRWTDALAVYSKTELYEPLMFRGAQVYETCTLARRLVATLTTRMERSRSPWPVRLLEAATRIRRELAISLPVQSDEALHLMSTAYACFGLERIWAMLEEARKSLESRSQWTKAQLLALVGVSAYLLEKLGVLGWIAGSIFPRACP